MEPWGTQDYTCDQHQFLGSQAVKAEMIVKIEGKVVV